MKTVLTTTELSERWGVNREYIISAVETGKLNAFNNTGSGSHKRFSIAYIEEIERQGGLEVARYDALKIKRLENELEKKNKTISQLKGMIEGFIAKAIQMKQEVGA